MAKFEFLRSVLFPCMILLSSLFLSTSAQSCKNYGFSNNRVFTACNDLPVLNSFLHWNYDSSTSKVQIAYRHTGVTPETWVAWAINPTSSGMIGSQAIVAFQKADGTIKVYTSSVSSYSTKLPEGKLSFPVSDLSATYVNSEMTIFATLELPNNGTTVNQVWQDGPLAGDKPTSHDTSPGPNTQSAGTLDFLSGQAANTGGGDSKLKKRNIHGVLNAVSWGVMMPLGAMTARYLKVFLTNNPTWFYLHVTCQTTAYIVGVAGWATGLKLGSESSGIQFDTHRNIGITLFCLGTLQVFALLLRPKPDHKYRLYWNIYHHSIGYIVILLSIVNIFKGFDILKPEKHWKNAYIAIIVILAINAVWLEGYTWFIVVKRRKKESLGMPNGLNGANGYGS